MPVEPWRMKDGNSWTEVRPLTTEQVRVLVEVLDTITVSLQEMAQKNWASLGLDLSKDLAQQNGMANRLLWQAFPELKRGQQ